MFQKGLRLAMANKSSFDDGGVALDRAATVPPTVRLFCQTPVKSGLPSAVLGAGAVMFSFPSGVLGTPAVGYEGHWAKSAGAAAIRTSAARRQRRE